MVRCAVLSAAGIAIAASTAQAAVFFTFADPTAPREVEFDSDSNTLSYDTGTLLNLVADATDEGAASTETFSAMLTMEITVGDASPISDVEGGFTAPVSGFFEFTLSGSGESLLRGEFSGGGLVTLGGAGAVISTSNTGLTYTAGSDLAMYLGDAGISSLVAPFDASFTLTDVEPAISVDDGKFEDFSANAAFTGTANIPAPGAIVLIGASALAASGRRRRV